MEGRLQCLGLGVDVGRVLGGEHIAHILDRCLDVLPGGVVDRFAKVLELALGLVGGVLAVVAGLRELAQAAVVIGVGLGVDTIRLISSLTGRSRT